MCRYATGYSRPELDAVAQDGTTFTPNYNQGTLVTQVTRPVETNEDDDISLTESRFLIIAHGSGFDGTTFNAHAADSRIASVQKYVFVVREGGDPTSSSDKLSAAVITVAASLFFSLI